MLLTTFFTTVVLRELSATTMPVGVGFRAAYNMVLRDSGVDAPDNDDPASDIAYDTVSHNSSVASTGNVDRRSAAPLSLA